MRRGGYRCVLVHPGLVAVLIVLAVVAGCVTRNPPTPESADGSYADHAASETAAPRSPAPSHATEFASPLSPPDSPVADYPAPRLRDLDNAARGAIESLMASMTLTERIGQRFIAPVQGTRMQHGAGRAISYVNPAGFIIYPWNYGSLDEARTLIESIVDFAHYVNPAISPFMSADQEGGRVAAIRGPEIAHLPSAATLGRLDDPSLVRAATYITSVQLRDLGVTMNFAPVLDVYPVADASIIGDRSLGGTADDVKRYVRPVLEAARAAGVVATAKHFPGHGTTAVDSHAELPIVDLTRAELEADHLPPFVEAIDAGVPAIMTAHLLFSEIDAEYPVTLSRVFLHDILRDELGFTGVVVTDGLEMRAIQDNFTIEETLVRLFRYDVDLILLYLGYDVIELVNLVEHLIKRGEITEDDVDRGVRRVLELKYRYGLLHPEAA